MPRYRIYSETLPYEDVTRPRTVELLRRYRLELVLAVRPWQLGALARVAATLRDEGIALSVWPMLEDEHGRWASVHNASRFFELVRATCDALEEAGSPARDVLLDLEPPFADARALADARFLRLGRRAPPAAFAAAARTFARGVAELRDRGITTSSAVWPLVALDPPGASGWQSLLGTPVDALSADHVSVMMYTSIIAVVARRVRQRDAVELLAGVRARASPWRARRISLGCVGTGAFLGDHAVTLSSSPRTQPSRARQGEHRALRSQRRPRASGGGWLDALVDGAPWTPRASRRVGPRSLGGDSRSPLRSLVDYPRSPRSPLARRLLGRSRRPRSRTSPPHARHEPSTSARSRRNSFSSFVR
jgi:hypothetical protein